MKCARREAGAHGPAASIPSRSPSPGRTPLRDRSRPDPRGGRARLLILLPVVALLLGALGLLAAAPAQAQTAQTVQSDWSLKPSGITAGQSFRLLFITSTGTSSRAANISSYNTHVQNAANSNNALKPFKGEFRALVSTSSTDARTNTATRSTDTDVPIYWLGGVKVADDYTDFYDGSWDSRTDRNESGATSSGVYAIATGSNGDGTKHSLFMGNSTGSVKGVFTRVNNPVSWGTGNHGNYQLYALSPVITVAATVTTAPAKPTGLTATPGNAQVTLGWTDPSDTSITKYQYQQKAGAAAWGSWTNIPSSAPGGTNATSYTVRSLMNGTAYRFRIRAVNAVGNGAQSDATSAATPAAPVTSTGAPVAQNVAADWSLIPKDSMNNPLFTAGQRFRLLFVTAASAPDPSSTVISTYNGFVQNAAGNNAALRPFRNQFRALVSTSAVDARDNTATTGTGVPIYWVQGDKVADNYADFYDGSWDSVPGKTETGGTRSGCCGVWTGSKDDGTKHANHAGHSTSYRVGFRSAGNSPFSAGTFDGSSVDLPLYGLSPVLTVSASTDNTPPTVTAGSTGYYGDAAAATRLSGPLKSGANIYTKVTFSEDMKQVTSDAATARPELFHRIGSSDTQYDTIAATSTLASGDCKPNHASETDEYICLYTVASSGDDGPFAVKVGTNSVDRANNALASVYTHATSITLDTTVPSIEFPAAGPRVGSASTITLTDVTAKVAKYGAIAVAATETDATGCDTATEIGGNLKTPDTPAHQARLRYAPPSDAEGKKVCVYAEDAAGNIHAALWPTAIAAAPPGPVAGSPAAPTGLRALGSKSNDGTVDLYWRKSEDDSITGYELDYHKTGETGGAWSRFPSNYGNQTYYTVRGLENNVEYAFRIRAVNAQGAGAASAVAWATPGNVTKHGVTLTRFKVEPGDDRLDIRWLKTAGRTYCGYVIEWRESGGTGAWQSREIAGSWRSPEYTIADLKPGTSYDVRLYVQSGSRNKPKELAWERTRTTTGAAPSQAPPVTVSALSWARVNGAELALRFDAALDEASVPAASAFSVTVADSARGVSSVSVSQDMATLTLASAVTSGEAVTVGYTPPSSGKLRRAGGGDVAAFSGQAVTNETPARQVLAGLTASVSNAPSEHRGRGRFTLRIAFSEAVTAKAKDAAIQVTGGTLSRAARVNKRRDLWELTVAPSSGEAVTVTLPATSDCSASGAICTADGRKLGTALTHSVAGPPAPELPALTASVSGAPSEHRGEGRFAVRIAFSAPVTAKPKNAGVQVTGGTLTRAARVDKRKDLWELTVKPSGYEAVTVTLPATSDCSASGAVCTADGRKLETTLTHTVQGPIALSVTDARAKEGEDATIDFAVTLSRAASGEVTVRYATRDGTAKKGKDYRKARGTLSFAAGEIAKTVSVTILDDAKDEGEETFTLVLTRATGAVIADGEAVGTIENDDPMPKAWLARFGRTFAGQAVDAVTARFESGGGSSQVTLGGQALSLDTPQGQAQAAAGAEAVAAALGAGPDGSGETRDRDAWMRGGNPAVSSHTMTGRELLLGSAFHLSAGGGNGAPVVAAWGRVAHGSFDGAEDGVTMNGEVTTGFLGADVASGRWLAGAAVAHSKGEGTFALAGNARIESDFAKGEIETTLTSLLPYARLTLNERVTAWAMLGYGTGELVLTEKGETETDRQTDRHTADLTMTLGAVGGRGTLVPAPEGGGFALALKGDAFWVRTEPDATEGMEGATADATRLRLALDASRPFALDGGGVLTPSLEAGLRLDGGDAETGAGLELGAGLAWTDPASGVTAELRGRWLAAHESSGYEEWGVSGLVRVDPGEAGHGLSLTLAPTVGAAASGTGNLWSAADARGLAPGGEFEAGRQLDAELGYGMALFGDRFTGTPNVGFGLTGAGARDYRLGWRLTSAVPGDPGFEIGLDATRRETANDNAPPEHDVMLRALVRW